MTDRLITDIGGLPSGAVPREEIPQLFWEKQMMAMFNVLLDKRVLNLDEFRRMVEQSDPEDYARSSFYGRRLDGMTALLIEKGLIQPDEIEQRTDAVLASGTRDHVP